MYVDDNGVHDAALANHPKGKKRAVVVVTVFVVAVVVVAVIVKNVIVVVVVAVVLVAIIGVAVVVRICDLFIL